MLQGMHLQSSKLRTLAILLVAFAPLIPSGCRHAPPRLSPQVVEASQKRWETEIAALEARDLENPPPKDGFLFVGSSSIKRWTNLAEAFPGRPVINHGFGGSQITDSVVYAQRIVIPQRPRLVVMYAGGNDINAGKSADQVFLDYLAFTRTVHAALPQTRIAFISIAPNPKRWSQIETVKQANALVESHVRTDPRLEFINVFPHMLGPDGKPKPDIFVADQLHMNAKGYAIWREVVGAYLK
jgi:lysophospholipase L1-like esterase